MKQLLTGLILSTAAAVSSCSVSDDGGSCPESSATIITGLGQSTLLSQSDTPLDSGLVQYELLESSETVQADRFMLAVVANAQFAVYQMNSHRSMLARIGNFFVGDATALSCVGPEFLSDQTLGGISITSDSAVSALYPAGSNLADVFRVGKQEISSPEFGLPTATIVARAVGNRETIAEYLSSQPNVPLLLAMTLDIVDPIASQHVFTVTYTLEDGSIFTTQTEPVSITP